MQAARDANVVTDIGISKTIGDTTVTLAWAYADAQNLEVGYKIKTQDNKPNKLLSSYNSPILSDATGAMFAYSSSHSNKEQQPDELTVVVSYYAQAVRPIKGTDNFDIL